MNRLAEAHTGVRVVEETVWLTQKLMAALFEVDVRTVFDRHT